MRKAIIGIILFLLLGACSNSDFGNLPSHTLPAPSLSSTPPLLLTQLPTKKVATPTAIDPAFLSIKSLKEGLYIAYGEVAPDKVYLSVISWDGVYQGRVAELIGGGSDLSPDEHFLADLPYIVDLDSGNRMYYDELENCTYPDWSPDSKKLAVSCPSANFHHDDIYIFSLQDRSKVPVTNCEFEAYSCAIPKWSPDGHWLAFYRGLGGSGTSKLVGVHILDMTCSSDLVNCWHDEIGIYVTTNFAWSLDGQLLAAVDRDKTFVFQIKDGKLILIETYKVGGSLDGVAWLNNNDLLVLDGKDEGGHIISRWTGLVSPLAEAQNRFFESHSGAFAFIFSIP